MRVVLLSVAATLAAITLPAAPAEAQQFGFSGRSSPSFHGDARGHRATTEWGQGRRDGRDRRRHRDFDGDFFIGDWEYQGDSLWRAESYNDWWHERPQRSYPAWISRNQNCERIWWSGGDWRC